MLSSCYHDFDDMSTYFSSSIVHFSQFVLLRAHNGNIRTLRNRFGILMNDKTSSSAFFRFIERSVGLCQKLCYVMWKQKMVRSDAAAHWNIRWNFGNIPQKPAQHFLQLRPFQFPADHHRKFISAAPADNAQSKFAIIQMAHHRAFFLWQDVFR